MKEAVIFGIGRSVPGVLLFPGQDATTLSSQEYLTRVWPAIEGANRAAEAFSKISKDMVVVLPPEAQLPAADKGSVLRARVYQIFEAEINQAYTQLHSGLNGATRQQLDLDHDELEQWLLEKCKVEFEMDLENTTTQLYQAGLDSLRATQLRALILNNIALGKGSAADFTVSKVFEAGTIQRLAAMIIVSRAGEKSFANNDGKDGLRLMQEFVEKYANFAHHKLASHHKSAATQQSGGMTVVSQSICLEL